MGMERIPLERRTELHDIVTGVYNLLFTDELAPDDVDLYYIESEHVEAEIEFPYIGINRTDWETEWSAERKIEVLLHEFAHLEEGPSEPDHGEEFYDRLSELATIAEDHRGEMEELFDTGIEFDAIHRHIVDSVNEYTVDVGTVEGRQQVLREELSAGD